MSNRTFLSSKNVLDLFHALDCTVHLTFDLQTGTQRVSNLRKLFKRYLANHDKDPVREDTIVCISNSLFF